MAGRIPLFLLACGSFNPITHQHLRLFELARDQMHQTGLYRVVGGIVSPVSDVYGKQGLVASNHRLTMARLALQNSDWVTVDDWETKQSDWLETVMTLRYHYGRITTQYHQKPGQHKDAPTENSGEPQLKLLCGADFMDTFQVPGLWRDDHVEEVVGRFGLVCVSRGNLQPDRTIHESDVLSKYRRNIFLVQEWVQNEISATEVRRALRRGHSVKYLLPDSVIDYIKENNLYTQESEMKNKEIKLRPLTKQTNQEGHMGTPE